MGHVERVELAREITNRLVARYGGDVLGVALFGSVARQDDAEHSDLDLMVVTKRGRVVPPGTMLVGPTVVTLVVDSLDDAMADAATIGPWWPLRADQYVNTKPMHDPEGVFAEIRRTYDHAMNSAHDADFDRPAARNLAEAISQVYRARAHLGRDERATAVHMAEAAVRAVLTVGLLTRFAFKNLSHALRIAPDLPNAPIGFATSFRAAFAPGASQAEAVSAMENAVEALLDEGERRKLPFAAADPAEMV